MLTEKSILEQVGRCKRNVYSQNGEDGIIAEIFNRIGAANKWCLEVGAADGIFCSNTRALIEQGWTAILIESEKAKFAKLRDNCKKHKQCKLYHGAVDQKEPLDKWLKQAGAPKNIDLLCVDIDGQDYHVFNGLLDYAPRVVIVEYDPLGESDFIPDVNGKGQAGSDAIFRLLASKGYHALIQTETNWIGIRDTIGGALDTVAVRAESAKLNLGCGSFHIAGYTNIDRQRGIDAYPLQCGDNSLDEIRASHLLEHFGLRQVDEVVKNWVSKLKPGGLLKIAVPDLAKIIRVTDEEERARISQYIMGGQTDIDDYHKSVFDHNSLKLLLRHCGLIRIEQWSDDVPDCASYPISLNLQGVKPLPEQMKPVKVDGVMSVGRLCFSANMGCAIKAFNEMRIEFTSGQGVFWGQILTRLMEKAIEREKEYIVTVDYDTWFQTGHLRRLLQLMCEYPEIDAVVPGQIKREEDRLLIGRHCAPGKDSIEVPLSEFNKPLFPIDTGHFGLTVLRVAALKRMPLPWFKAEPGPDGRWGEGRLDDDIWFWHKWKECGNTAFLANEVNVGHLQLMCTFPGTPQNDFAPIHRYANDVETGNIPAHCRMP